MNTYPNDNYGLPPQLTPHNPHKLTREQVGKNHRLLATTEIWDRQDCKMNIETWHYFRKIWDNSGWFGSLESFTYRVPIDFPLDIHPSIKTVEPKPESVVPKDPVSRLRLLINDLVNNTTCCKDLLLAVSLINALAEHFSED